MSKVVIDNWGLSTCLSKRFNNFRENYGEIYSEEFIWDDADECWENLLNAIILWDKIYINQDWRTPSVTANTIVNLSNLVPLKSNQFIRPVCITDHRNVSMEVFKGCVEYKLQRIYKELEKETENKVSKSEQILLLRGYDYMLEANYLGCAYLPHPRRSKLLYDSGIFRREFDAQVYIDIIEKDVREYINAVNELSQHQLLSTHFPILYQFISSMATTPSEELAVAVSLREDKNVIQFRKSVNNIERELLRGDIQALRASLIQTKEICKKVANSLYGRPLTYEVTLGLSPAINVGTNFEFRVSSGIHTTFLTDLLEFALKGKTSKRYRRYSGAKTSRCDS